MSGAEIIWFLLASNSGLLAAVPKARIKSGVLPLDTVLPAISVQVISGSEHNNVPMNSAFVLMTNRVQVSVLAKTYADQKSILDLVRSACPNTHGDVNGAAVDSILPDTIGPDLFDAEETVYMQSRDFIVKYSQAR
jgi:hypothetical protein